MTRLIVLDTSYLLEFLEVPGLSDPAHAREIRSRIDGEIDARSVLYVPITARRRRSAGPTAA